MTYTLRDYQAAGVDRTLNFLLNEKKGNGIVYAPTGSGKSLMIGTAAVELARHSRGGPVIVLQPTKEILEQNDEKIRSYGFRTAICSASKGRRDLGDVTLATIGTVFRHPEWFDDFMFCLPDECHLMGAKDNSKIVAAGERNEFFHREHGLVRELRNQEGVAKGKVLVVDEEGKEQTIPRPKKSMHRTFLDALPHLRLVGYTASPYRLISDALGSQLQVITRSRPRIFDQFIHWTQNRELFDSEYLTKLEYYRIKGFKREKIPANSTGAEYNEEALQMHLFEKNWETRANGRVDFKHMLTDVAERVLSAGRKHVLVFTGSILESEHLAQQMGGECAVLTGETSRSERESILNDFKSGAFKVVTNCGVLIHGFDFPELDCVIDAAPTMSLSRYYQKIGRGIRTHPNKESTWIVDMVGGLESFGRVEDLTLYCDGQRKWNVYGRPGIGKEVALTHVYLNGGNKGLCPKCLAPKFMAYYPDKTKWLPISIAPVGRNGNVIIEQSGGKKVCRIVKRGDPDAKWVLHFAYCSIFQKLRKETA